MSIKFLKFISSKHRAKYDKMMHHNEELYKQIEDLDKSDDPGKAAKIQSLNQEITANYLTYAPYEINVPSCFPYDKGDRTPFVIEEFFAKELDLDFKNDGSRKFVPAVIDSWVIEQITKLEINTQAREMLKALIKVMDEKPSLVFAAVYREDY